MRYCDAHQKRLRNPENLNGVRWMTDSRSAMTILTVASPHAKSSSPSDDLSMKRLYSLIMKHSKVQVIKMQPTTTMTPP
jgi:hypothetical protein